ncbi:MAG: carotenoid oxygenase family protein [Pseudomonadota bacterium]
MKKFDLNAGALAPVDSERSLKLAPSQGEIPPDLQGTLYRNGPNPFGGRFEGNTMLDWWPAPGMVHAFKFSPEDECPIEYSNRWLRTPAHSRHLGLPEAANVPETNPNVSLLDFNDEIMALGEGVAPLHINHSLSQADKPSLEGSLLSGMTAHPKVDPQSGDLVWFFATPASEHIKYGVVNASGQSVVEASYSLPQPVFMHDFAITQSKSILFDLNVVLDTDLALAGDPFPISWDQNKAARLGFLPRVGGSIDWLEIEPCFLQHVANCFEIDERSLVLDAVRYPYFLKRCERTGNLLDNPLGTLWRYEIDLRSRRVKEYPLMQGSVEFPQINPSRTGRVNRFVYMAEQERDDEIRGVVKLDTQTGRQVRHWVESGDQNSEPIFVSCGRDVEDDGYILLLVYRAATDTSELRILDAQRVDGEPIATVPIPYRVPAGFHGLWVHGGY